ncbi:MAG: cyclic nucleotide-binding domain-containing protein [Bacteriovoracaceae bacterium]|nr:cyclic nucleotide-binding domain-containing protein [Bacteriovoracaceae bacterium]
MKKTKYPITSLKTELIEKIKSVAPIHKYTVQSDLFYEGQTPVVAFLLLDGHVQLVKNKKIKKVLSFGDLIGLKELIHHLPYPLSAQVLPNTEMVFLDKSTILEILNLVHDQELSEVFKEIISEDQAV